MTIYVCISTRHTNSNTAQHGYGDYPESECYIKCAVDAETKRKAMNKVKKLFPNTWFSGINQDFIMSESEYDKDWHSILGDIPVAIRFHALKLIHG